MMKFDLHIHSTHSNDGELEIDEIINVCLRNKIEIISVTDHNSTRGNREALSICREAGIGFIPGIEIDCNYQGTDLHLLGYQIDWTSDSFAELEASNQKINMDAVPMMIHNLAKAGIEIDADELMEKSAGKLPTPEFFAEVLLGNKKYHSNRKLAPYLTGGAKSDMPYINFYLDYFAQGRPAYVKLESMEFADAVELVKGHGGIPVVAHPGLNFRGQEGVADQLLDAGAEGLEVFNNYHDQTQMAYFASLVRDRGKLMTGGSDFHGKVKPMIRLGGYPVIESHLKFLNESIHFIFQHGQLS